MVIRQMSVPNPDRLFPNLSLREDVKEPPVEIQQLPEEAKELPGEALVEKGRRSKRGINHRILLSDLGELIYRSESE
jgi:hypothetical protein